MSDQLIVPSRPPSLEKMLNDLLVEGSKHVSLVPDKEGRFQANLQKGRSATFSCHLSNDPVEALYGALGGLPAIKLWREIKAERLGVSEPEFRPVDNPDDPHMTYWYHPESSSVWECMSNELPPDLGDGMSHQITEEEYKDFLNREKPTPTPFHDPELDDLL